MPVLLLPATAGKIGGIAWSVDVILQVASLSEDYVAGGFQISKWLTPQCMTLAKLKNVITTPRSVLLH